MRERQKCGGNTLEFVHSTLGKVFVRVSVDCVNQPESAFMGRDVDDSDYWSSVCIHEAYGIGNAQRSIETDEKMNRIQFMLHNYKHRLTFMQYTHTHMHTRVCHCDTIISLMPSTPFFPYLVDKHIRNSFAQLLFHFDFHTPSYLSASLSTA